MNIFTSIYIYIYVLPIGTFGVAFARAPYFWQSSPKTTSSIPTLGNSHLPGQAKPAHKTTTIYIYIYIRTEQVYTIPTLSARTRFNAQTRCAQNIRAHTFSKVRRQRVSTTTGRSRFGGVWCMLCVKEVWAVCYLWCCVLAVAQVCVCVYFVCDVAANMFWWVPCALCQIINHTHADTLKPTEKRLQIQSRGTSKPKRCGGGRAWVGL